MFLTVGFVFLIAIGLMINWKISKLKTAQKTKIIAPKVSPVSEAVTPSSAPPDEGKKPFKAKRYSG